MAERGAGLPKTSLSPNTMLAGYGQTLSMSGIGSGWFGPQRPLAPTAPPDVAGRAFDFPPGYNLAVRPKAYEPISFEQLRMLADGYDLLRVIIETRKDQLERMDWSIRPKNKARVPAGTLDAITKFFMRPSPDYDFTSWLRLLMEDLFVLDAPALWKQRNNGGQLIALHPLDGATIKRVVDDWGRTPRGFDAAGNALPAYQQILKGFPAVNYTADDIIYAPRNVRSNRVYGYSPVEQVIVTVNIALRRQAFQLSYYTEGNIPEALIGVPDGWTPDQIKNFQDYWDLYFTGDLAARRRAKFVPGGVAKTYISTKEPELKNIFDEWLARIISYAFSVSPQALVMQQNRATANTQKELSEEEGLLPILRYVKRLIDGIIVNEFGQTDIEFAWGDDEQIDPATEATVYATYLDRGVYTRNEIREKLGEDAFSGVLEADMLMTAQPVAPLDGASEPPEPPVVMAPGATAPKPAPNTPKPNDTAKTPESKDKKSDAAQKINELLDLAKYEEDQPRDDHGRFALDPGVKAAKEQAKAEKEKAGPKLDAHGRVHGRGGLFSKGITKEKAINTFHSIGAKVAIAGVLGGIGAAVGAVALPIGAAAVVSTTANGMAAALLVQSVEQALSLGFRSAGADAKFATKASALIRRNVKDSITLARSMKESTKSDEEATKFFKSVAEDHAELSVAVDFAKEILPIYTQKVRDAYAAQLSLHPDLPQENVAAFEQGVDDACDEFLVAVAQLDAAKMLDDTAEKLAKRAKQLPAISTDRPAAKRASARLAKKIYSAFQNMHGEVADYVRAHVTEKVAKGSFNLSQREKIRVALESELSGMASDSGDAALVQLNVDTSGDAVNSAASTWASSHTDELIQNLDDSTQQMISSAISTGLDEGLSVEDIVAKVQDAGFSADRAKLIADTEIGNANSQGALEGYKAAADAGVNIMKAWVTVGDDGVDADICQANEDQGPIPVDDAFQSGHMAPLGHPRCRCTLVPVVDDTPDDNAPTDDGENTDG